MQVKIAATLPRLAKQGELQALRSISKLGKITYQGLGFSGDNTIKNEVISRFIAEESQPHDTAITPANYKFKHKGDHRDRRPPDRGFSAYSGPKSRRAVQGRIVAGRRNGNARAGSGQTGEVVSVFLKKVEFVQ